MSPQEFKDWQKEMGCSRYKAAEALGYSYRSISNWVSPSRGTPIPDRIEVFCRYLLADKRGLIDWSRF